MTSRFITYPDIVDSDNNHPVLLIDPTQYNIEDIALFCKVSESDFDIYLYNHDLNDLEWLSEVSKRVNKILISAESRVEIRPTDEIIKFGSTENIVNPLEYFQEYNN